MRINVAIVEDDADIRQSLEEIVSSSEEMNCVAAFPNAEEFIEAFRYINADVVLMDINLPGKDGIKAVEELKPLKPKVQYLMPSLVQNQKKQLLFHSPQEKSHRCGNIVVRDLSPHFQLCTIKWINMKKI